MQINIVEKGRKWNQYYKNKSLLEQVAHPMDTATIRHLEVIGVKTALNPMMQLIVSQQFGPVLSSGIVIDKENFEELNNVFTECVETLGIERPSAVVTNAFAGTLNACAMGTDEEPFILVSNLMPKIYSHKEIQFILGHECGHIAMEHMIYHTALNLLLLVPQVFLGKLAVLISSIWLKRWSRCSEITADRLGLLCCGDLETAQLALLKLESGFTDISSVDIHKYIQDSKHTYDSHSLGKFHEYFASHPMIFKRLEALEMFYNSAAYYEASHLTPPPDKKLISKAYLDEKTNEIMKVF